MAIVLDGGGHTPSVKFREKQQAAVLAVINFEWIPELEFGTDRPKLNRKGEPRKQLRIQGFWVGGNACLRSEGEDIAAKKGDECALYVSGGKLGGYFEARKASGGLQVGDMMKVTYTHDEPSKGGGNDLKVWGFEIRRAKESEAGLLKMCEERYHALKAERDAASSPDAPHDPMPADDRAPPMDDSSIPF